MWSAIDPVRADAVLRVDDSAQRERGADDGRERGRGRNHEHDYCLQPRGLLYGRAAEDGFRHHPWIRNDTEDAVIMDRP